MQVVQVATMSVPICLSAHAAEPSRGGERSRGGLSGGMTSTHREVVQGCGVYVEDDFSLDAV